MNASGINIITDFNKGDPKAFNRVFSLYYARIRYFAFKLTGSKEDSEDITLESFSKLFERYRDFETEANIRAFLYVAARNAGFNFLRRQQRVQTGKAEIRYLQQDEFADPVQVEVELISMIYKAIESLPAERKKVFKLLYIDGLKIAGVAEQLGISVNTVKSQRAKAIMALQGILGNKELALFVALTAGSAAYSAQ